MNEGIKERISALVDGELSEFEVRRVLEEIESDPKLKEYWSKLQVSRDCPLIFERGSGKIFITFRTHVICSFVHLIILLTNERNLLNQQNIFWSHLQMKPITFC